MKLEDARANAYRKIETLKPNIAALLSDDFEIYLIGSLQTGLYYGPKSSSFSSSPNCPYAKVVEADIRLVIPENIHPHDETLLTKMADICGAESTVKRHTVHWDRTDVEGSSLYWYDALESDTAFEWEFCINRRPYVEIAPYWEQLFTPDEVEWQRNLRQLVTTIELPSEIYTPFKWKQTTEARWRLVASHALTQIDRTEKSGISDGIPVKSVPLPPVDRLVTLWLEGASGYRTMERPENFIPDEVLTRLKTKYDDAIIAPFLSPPAEPEWVSKATRIQNQLKNPAQNLII